MAAAFAILMAKEFKKKTLVISTDPAHSLSDSLDQQLTGEPTPVDDIPNLYALELDTSQTIENLTEILMDSNDPMISGIVAQVLGEDSTLLDATPPGSDEAVAFLKMLEFIENPIHDIIVFDTAPTGHTLRLLNLPEVLESWLWRVLSLRSKFSSLLGGLRHILGGSGGIDERQAVARIEELRDQVLATRDLLADPTVTEFVPVAIPENMAIYETERLLQALRSVDIPSKNIIVNNIVPKNPACSLCTSRSEMQQKNIQKIRDFFPEQLITEVPLFDTEIRGRELLEKLAFHLLN